MEIQNPPGFGINLPQALPAGGFPATGMTDGGGMVNYPINHPIPLPGLVGGGFHHGPLSMAVAARHLVAAHAHRQAAARAALAATSPRSF